MRCDITKRIAADMDRWWMNLLASMNGRLEDEKSLDGYLAVLHDYESWNSLSFCLRRYVYLHFTGRRPDAPSRPYTVELDGHPYAFSSVDPKKDVTEQELRDYADLLYRMTIKNRCYAKRADGSWDEKKGAIQKQQYFNYLSGRRIYRKNLFPMSVALGFGVEDMEKFMNVLGESPVYNFRSARECIYYFCHSVPAFRNAAAVDELERAYEEIRTRVGIVPSSPAGMTAQIHSGIDSIVQEKGVDDRRKRERFLNFLEKNASEFTFYSKTARELLLEEIQEDALLDTRKGEDDVLGILFTKSQRGEKRNRSGIERFGEELFHTLMADGWYENKKEVQKTGMDPRLTEDLPDGVHFRRAVYEEDDAGQNLTAVVEQVTKKDFLLLRFYKLGKAMEAAGYSPKERLELVKRFHLSTDRILIKAGLPPIYIGNPLDHLVLSALCTPSPIAFFQQAFYRTPRGK